MKMDWTHTSVVIEDVRKIQKLYVLYIKDKEIKTPLLVNENIFNERLRSYFLKDPNRVTREEILSVHWNFYITKGYYIKIQAEDEDIKKFDNDPNKYYVSYLEINGPLATFQSVYKQPKEEKI